MKKVYNRLKLMTSVVDSKGEVYFIPAKAIVEVPDSVKELPEGVSEVKTEK